MNYTSKSVWLQGGERDTNNDLNKIMVKSSCPRRLIEKLRLFHDGMQARVQNDSWFSEYIRVTNWVNHDFDIALVQLFKAVILIC